MLSNLVRTEPVKKELGGRQKTKQTRRTWKRERSPREKRTGKKEKRKKKRKKKKRQPEEKEATRNVKKGRTTLKRSKWRKA